MGFYVNGFFFFRKSLRIYPFRCHEGCWWLFIIIFFWKKFVISLNSTLLVDSQEVMVRWYKVFKDNQLKLVVSTNLLRRFLPTDWVGWFAKLWEKLNKLYERPVRSLMQLLLQTRLCIPVLNMGKEAFFTNLLMRKFMAMCLRFCFMSWEGWSWVLYGLSGLRDVSPPTTLLCLLMGAFLVPFCPLEVST